MSPLLTEEHALCSDSPLFEAIVALYFLVLVLWGCQLAWRTRNLPSVFNESKCVRHVAIQHSELAPSRSLWCHGGCLAYVTDS